MVYERLGQRLLARHRFAWRVVKAFAFSALLISVSLGIGIVGYMKYGSMGFVDGLYNASMILTGMGPVSAMTSDEGKIFASFYALFSGIAFLSSVGVLIAPIVHRFYHRFHVGIDDGKDP